MLKQTLLFIFSSSHIFSYLTLFLVLTLLTIDGIFLLHFLLKTKNKLLLLGGGAIVGILGFLFSLYLFSYLLKPPLGIVLIFIVFTVFNFSLYYFFIGPKKLLSLFIFRITIENIFLIALLLSYCLFIFLFVNGAGYAGDVSTYWSLATSFSQGNYPTVTPWQPNFLSGYHQGTIMVMGALHGLTGLSMVIIHYALSIYLCFALLLFMTGWMRESFRSNWSILPAVFVLINFGGPIFSFYPLSGVHFADLISFKGTTGSCGVWLGDFTFCNFRLLGFVGFLFFLYVFLLNFSNSLRKSIFLVIILFLILSVDESLALICFVLLAASFLNHHVRTFTFKKFVFESAILTLLAIILFFAIQNPIRDGLLNPQPRHSRFALLSPQNPEFGQRLSFMSGGVYSVKTNPGAWYVIDIRIVLIFLFLFSLIYKSRALFYIACSAVIILGFSFIFYDYFWAANGRRMILTSYQLGMFGLGYLLLLVKNAQNRVSILFLSMMIIILIPQTISSHLRIYKAIQQNTISNLIFNYDYHDQVLDSLKPYVSTKDRILFFDEYPLKATSSTLTTKALIDYGMFVPTAPRDVKITNIDSGPEWYDFMLSMDPRSIRELSPSLIYVSSQRYTQLAESQKIQISSPNYFLPIFSNAQGTLYLLQSEYRALPSDSDNFYSMMHSIPDNESVYVDIFDFPEIRRGLILRLSDSHLLFGPAYNYGGDFYMHLEYTPRFTPLKNLTEGLRNQNIRFLFLNPKNVTKEVQEKFILKKKIQGVELWERQDSSI